MNGSDMVEWEEAHEQLEKIEHFQTIGSFREWLEDEVLLLSPYEKRKAREQQ